MITSGSCTFVDLDRSSFVLTQNVFLDKTHSDYFEYPERKLCAIMWY